MTTSLRPSGDAARCNICGTTFSRQEHLSRHRKSHTREKPFRCPVCGKNFARQDVRSRHVATHDVAAREGATPVRLRACRQCAVCRVRCSRTEPCSRCSARSLTCVYPPDPTTRAPLSPAVDPHVEHPAAPADPHSPIQRPEHDLDNGTQLHGSLPRPGVAVGATDAASTPNGISSSDLHSSHLHADARTLQSISWHGQPAPLGVPDQPSYHGGLAPENGVNEQIAELLAMNWISPDYSHRLDWTDMLAAESLTQLDASRTLFPFLFDAPVPEPAVDDPLPSADSQARSSDTYTTQIDPAAPPAFDRRYSASGGSANESAPTVSDAPSSYVEGGEARAAFAGRLAQQRQDTRVLPQPGSLTIQEEESVSEILVGFTLVTPAAYNNMVQHIRTEVQQFTNLEAAGFPSYQRIAALVRLFFEKFYPIFPFIRRTGFSQESLKQWMLLLAVAVIGTRYADRVAETSSDDVLVQSLDIIANSRLQGAQEYFNDQSTPNAILTEPESSHLDLPTLQAIILDIVWKLHSGKKSLVKRALAGRYWLVTECTRMRLLSAVADEMSPDPRQEAELSSWLVKQSHLRTGMMIWLLDFMAAYQYSAPPLMQLVDAKGHLPCPDHAWEAPSLDRIQSDGKCSVYLLDAVEMLYIEKRLPPYLTEFGAILLIHGILRRTREAITQTQTQLCSWIPTANVQQRAGQRSRNAESWPPATPLLSRWRNSACDCLDILHWRANAKAAGSAGWEHPTILHLHVSRLVLLTPTGPLHTLAVLAGDATCTSNPQYVEARAVVLRWAIHDCFKARLSVVHAGAVFWHVRRYSSGMFLEPFAVYMSTLVLWAYSISAQSAKHRDQRHNQRSAENTSTASISGNIAYGTGGPSPIVEVTPASAAEEDETVEPSFIHLDRPCDDEVVQTYIRKGTQISADMARVGNITDDGAAAKILQEGLRLLSAGTKLPPTVAPAEQVASRSREGSNATITPGQWGAEQSFAGVLESLIRAMGSQRRD
ncbi:hypothetical protein B0I37DRAFT_64372 [Chaetomium sp. MPI-CAGE-AT-0009]|nr:hypothetical protein B0I37DRAFT_64372 [Chaetomium sp. MPI-CAGE-AT-0009]